MSTRGERSTPMALAAFLGALLSLPAAAEPPEPRFNTRSIVACDPVEVACGIAVVSFPTGVPAIVPVGAPGVSVANQSFPSLPTAQAIVDGILVGGMDAPAALAAALAADPAPEDRQLGVAALYPTASGVSVANHTGAANFPATCDRLGDTYAVQANLQTSASVCRVMAGRFERRSGSLARRLLTALLAGSRASSDARGEFSAALKVYSAVWPLAGLSELSADANVNRSADWEEDLAYEVNAYLATLTPPDPRDRVELSKQLAKRIKRALKRLGYYGGAINGRWPAKAERALLAFEARNIFFLNPTVEVEGVRFVDGPLADYLVTGEKRSVLVPAP